LERSFVLSEYLVEASVEETDVGLEEVNCVVGERVVGGLGVLKHLVDASVEETEWRLEEIICVVG
jgi:hypothetical protein